MDNEIIFLRTSYLFTRLAVVAAFAYAFYRILRPKPALASATRSSASARQGRIVFDDHC